MNSIILLICATLGYSNAQEKFNNQSSQRLDNEFNASNFSYHKNPVKYNFDEEYGMKLFLKNLDEMNISTKITDKSA